MLHLKEDAGEFLTESALKDLIHRYSEFITFPIYQLVEKEEEVEVEDDEEEVGDDDAGESFVLWNKRRRWRCPQQHDTIRHACPCCKLLLTRTSLNLGWSFVCNVCYVLC